MCKYCEENESFKSANFCGSAKAQVLGHYLDIYGNDNRIMKNKMQGLANCLVQVKEKRRLGE